MRTHTGVLSWDRLGTKSIPQPNELKAGEFIGRVVKTAPAVDAMFTVVRHDRAAHLPWHSHEAAYFCLLLSGAYTEHYGNQSIDYRPFMMTFHPPGFSHSDEIGCANSVFFLIELLDAWRERLDEIIDLRSVKVELRGSDMVWLTMRIFREFIEGFNPQSELHVESLLYELVAMAARLPDRLEAPEVEWFNSALQLIDARFTETLSVNMIADAAGVHPVTLARAFRRHFQQTASEYIQRLRIRRACELILGSDAGLSSIGAECGFTDQSYFTKVFKDITGTTPAAFRQTTGRAI